MASISRRKIDDTRTLTAAQIGMMIGENETDTQNRNLHGTIIDHLTETTKEEIDTTPTVIAQGTSVMDAKEDLDILAPKFATMITQMARVNGTEGGIARNATCACPIIMPTLTTITMNTDIVKCTLIMVGDQMETTIATKHSTIHGLATTTR
jgi:hypothetical protein